MMDSKEAVEVLHNNQYQKHLGNGEYDYIHPLTDAEAKAIEELIQQQGKMIGLACKTLEKKIPGYTAHYWRKYLQSEVSK